MSAIANRLHRLSPRAMLLLVLAAGAASILSFAPLAWWPLQILTLAVLFTAVESANSMRRAALYGLLFASGWIACGMWWLYVSMHRFGGLPGWMAAFAVALLAAALATYTAGAMAVAYRLRTLGVRRAVLLLAAMPALWMLAEWVRGWLFTGLPWVVSGYAHTDSPLSGFAPVLGVYGLGWLSAVLAGCLVLLNKRALAVAVLIIVAGLGLRQVNWTEPHAGPITVRLIQGNVPQEMKFAQDQILATLQSYRQLMTAMPADLVATPEIALPLLAERLPADYLPGLQQYANATGTRIVLGVPTSDGVGGYSNTALGIAPAGGPGPGQLYRYDKHHLVPFGEFIPPGARWFVKMMNIPLGDFMRADVLQPAFAVKEQRVMPNICYEDLFGEEIAAQLAHDWRRGELPATMLLNLSNIAWFGDTIALPQHLQISRMRSMETGRPMLRSTNTGVTAVIDSHGHVTARLPSYERNTLAASVQGMQGWTPYMLAGNLPVLAIAALMLVLAWFSSRRNRAQGPGETRRDVKTR